MKTKTTILLLLASFSFVSAAQSPYAGHDRREIKSLSEADVDGYLAGSGMGYAKAAELNHYPGPKHVLELATVLALSEQQLAQTGIIYKTMQHQAAELGRQMVHKESELDQLFANSTITSELLKNWLAEIAALQAEIRYAHLAAHLEQRAVLSEHQARQYDQQRGYTGGHSVHKH